jgi:Homeodomain-like domain
MEQQGIIDAEIAKRLGISRQAVSAARKRWNLPKGVRKRDVPPEVSAAQAERDAIEAERLASKT